MRSETELLTLRAIRRDTGYLVPKHILELKHHYNLTRYPLIRMEHFRRAKYPEDLYDEGFGNI